MDLSVNSTLNKLILLFVLDKMDFPLLEDNILNISSQSNNWIPWMECKETVAQLLESGFIYQSIHENKMYFSITPDGRMCLSHFFTRIPTALRAEIADYIKDNRMDFRRKQEYFRNYSKNADGTYTVHLKIVDPAQTALELKLNVSSRHTAKLVYNKWEEKAAQVYYLLHEQLID
ncbi:MAG: DUF4364 family protein [Firmicutes bacterium]|nr:DUF4364 family protein [Bacillota bacterium]